MQPHGPLRGRLEPLGQHRQGHAPGRVQVDHALDLGARGMHRTVSASRPAILMEVLEGYRERLENVVETLWPGLYDWASIEEGPGHESRNVLLTPRR